MQRISRIYVSNFGSPTAWYDHILVDMTDPESGEATDVVFNLENGGGKTSLLSFVFSCFDPRQDRWLQHLQKKSHRFSEYFVRDGRPAYMLIEWDMPPRVVGGTPYKLILGQAVALRDSGDRSADTDRWFFAFDATADMTLEAVPAIGLNLAPVRTMSDFVQWMHHAGKRASDFFHTRHQEDWVRHLTNARLLDVELLRMQVDFNSNEGGMEEGFLTFNNESDLLRRFMLLTLDAEKSATVRDAVAQATDRLKAKPKYERRLEQLTRLQSVIAPFAEAAALFESAEAGQREIQLRAAGVATALLVRKGERENIGAEKNAYAKTQDDISGNANATATLKHRDVISMQGLQHDRAVKAGEARHAAVKESLTGATHTLKRIEGAQALVRVEAAIERVNELEALEESEREGLKPARSQAEIQGALLRSALYRSQRNAEVRKDEAQEAESKANARVIHIKGQQKACAATALDLAA